MKMLYLQFLLITLLPGESKANIFSRAMESVCDKIGNVAEAVVDKIWQKGHDVAWFYGMWKESISEIPEAVKDTIEDLGEFKGFAEKTLIKTPTGFEKIEDIKPGNYVCSIDGSGKIIACRVTNTTSIKHRRYTKKVFEWQNKNIELCCGLNQLFFSPANKLWFAARETYEKYFSFSEKVIYPKTETDLRENVTLYSIDAEGAEFLLVTELEIIIPTSINKKLIIS